MRSLKYIIMPLLLTLTEILPGQKAGTVLISHSAPGSSQFPYTSVIGMPSDPYGREADTVLTLLFAGDIMGHDGQIAAARDDSTGTYSYFSVFKYISPLISSVDVAIGNLEVTLGGPPYKGYPAFSSPDELAVACRNAGFDILGTANNHSADRGPRGIFRTIRVLDSLGIRHTGTWISPEERDILSPLMIGHESMRIALLAYTYGTNGIVVPPPATVAYIDTVRAAADIKRAGFLDADQTVIFIHWGIEYDTLPSADQKKTAEALQRGGADIIIGSHPHVVQPVKAETDSTGIRNPVVWSMGNFVSNQRTRRRDGGVMIRLEITASGDSAFISDAGYVLTWVYTPVEDGKKKFYILPCAEYESKPGFFQSPEDFEAMMIYIADARRLLENQGTGFRELTFDGMSWAAVER
ncbi:MAG: CapA family protein [Bacteroidales bacterium]|jgi:poly-gamma-glutamate synthesis protein (capsule biosynthesis protein)|nr:CapA family protein [Bacteroidales bacterium]